MTELETEVKIERNLERGFRRDERTFSQRNTSSSVEEDLKRFDTYKPTDLNEIFSRLEAKTELKSEKKIGPKQNFDTDLDKFIKLDQDECPVILSKTVEVAEPKAKLNINLQGKLTIFVFSVALVLFAFLAIFNAVTIHKLNSSISGLNESIETTQMVVNEKINTYNALTDELRLEGKAAELGFEKIDDSNVHTLLVQEVNSNSSNEAKTNWFDNVCEWVASIFGA